MFATAVHAGHELRSEVAARIIAPSPERLREEDPGTDRIAAYVGSHVAVNRSRFEVDLNRERADAMASTDGDQWGIDLWGPAGVDGEVAEKSRQLHDGFYRDLASVLDRLAANHGGFVVYDVHSYNHRRDGPGTPPAPPADNPTVNLGTGSLPERWEPVADAFLTSMSGSRLGGEPIDARCNVKFEGRFLASWVHSRYGEVGCALAIEFKKIYMDEWTGRIDRARLRGLGEALAATTGPVWAAHQACL